MFYAKNVGPKERWVRGAAGAAMIVCGAVGVFTGVLGWGLAVAGGFTALSGLVGFCPACALAGRRLKEGR